MPEIPSWRFFAVNHLNAWPFGEFKKFTSSQKLIVIC